MCGLADAAQIMNKEGRNVYGGTVSDPGGKRLLLLAQPGQIRRLSHEQIGNGIHEDGIGRLGLEATCLLQREDAFHPAIALPLAVP
jgi:hypothetical protein